MNNLIQVECQSHLQYKGKVSLKGDMVLVTDQVRRFSLNLRYLPTKNNSY